MVEEAHFEAAAAVYSYLTGVSRYERAKFAKWVILAAGELNVRDRVRMRAAAKEKHQAAINPLGPELIPVPSGS